MAEVLPYALATWDEYEPDDGDVFVAYDLKRLNPHTGEVETVATVTDVETTEYHDYLAFPGANTYQLTVTVDRLGAIIESDPVEVSGVEFAWRGVWLHEVQDATEQARLQASSLDHQVQQGQTYRLAAGRRRETLFTGPLMARTLAMELVPEDLRQSGQYDALERLLDRQYTAGAVLCVRYGARAGARYIVQVDGGPSEELAGALSRPRVTLREVAMPDGWA